MYRIFNHMKVRNRGLWQVRLDGAAKAEAVHPVHHPGTPQPE